MLETIPDLPAGVIGFRADGELHSDDYEQVLIPAVDAQLATGEGIRIVMVFPEWSGMSSGATWDDLKMGMEHLTSWKKLALVTDIDWMTHLTKLFGWMTPGEMKTFPMAERDAAVAWVAAD